VKCLSEEEIELIPAKWIEIYYYCPRIIYFIGVLGIQEREKAFMKEGKNAEEIEEEKEKRRITLLAKRKEKVLRKWTNQFFYSKKIGIKGEVDLIVETENGIKVIEIKNTSWKKLKAGDLYQTAAYALLVEEIFNSIVKSLIVYYLKSDKVFEINFSDELRDHVKWIIKRINKIIENEEMPKIKRKRECKGCGYYSFCKGL